jgi:putative spermidine/putrescine transport system ATP-binding protein
MTQTRTVNTLSESNTAVRFRNVNRHFGTVRAVDDLTLDIEKGEFFALLGPSGSGKTTCLRLIAGFEQPTSGSIEIFGEQAAGIPPYKRNVNTVFQDYALFPHMTILENVAYGLMVKGVDRETRVKKSEAALELVALGGYGARKPAQLSGGQRQRVALARALVNEPKVLLLDEPLGALDLKLREQMQEELKDLQRNLGITFVFVTHDQGEALSMANRVAIFNEGRIVQVGAPQDVYDRPRTRFVANFVGSSNVLPPSFTTIPHWCSLRPERIEVTNFQPKSISGSMSHAVTVKSLNYQGAITRIHATADDGTPLIAAISNPRISPGQRVWFNWPSSAINHMDEQA